MKDTPMSRDFSPKTHKALAAKGVTIVNVFTRSQIMAIIEQVVEV